MINIYHFLLFLDFIDELRAKDVDNVAIAYRVDRSKGDVIEGNTSFDIVATYKVTKEVDVFPITIFQSRGKFPEITMNAPVYACNNHFLNALIFHMDDFNLRTEMNTPVLVPNGERDMHHRKIFKDQYDQRYVDLASGINNKNVLVDMAILGTKRDKYKALHRVHKYIIY